MLKFIANTRTHFWRIIRSRAARVRVFKSIKELDFKVLSQVAFANACQTGGHSVFF